MEFKGDLISRQAAIDAIHCDIAITGRQNAELVTSTIGAFVDRIKALSSADVVQVCRCRDCKYFYEDIGICDNTDALVSPTADSFCSYGEREE